MFLLVIPVILIGFGFMMGYAYRAGWRVMKGDGR